MERFLLAGALLLGGHQPSPSGEDIRHEVGERETRHAPASLETIQHQLDEADRDIGDRTAARFAVWDAAVAPPPPLDPAVETVPRHPAQRRALALPRAHPRRAARPPRHPGPATPDPRRSLPRRLRTQRYGPGAGGAAAAGAATSSRADPGRRLRLVLDARTGAAEARPAGALPRPVGRPPQEGLRGGRPRLPLRSSPSSPGCCSRLCSSWRTAGWTHSGGRGRCRPSRSPSPRRAEAPARDLTAKSPPGSAWARASGRKWGIA